jgi:hypothetical protein
MKKLKEFFLRSGPFMKGVMGATVAFVVLGGFLYCGLYVYAAHVGHVQEHIRFARWATQVDKERMKALQTGRWPKATVKTSTTTTTTLPKSEPEGK